MLSWPKWKNDVFTCNKKKSKYISPFSDSTQKNIKIHKQAHISYEAKPRGLNFVRFVL